MPKQRHLSPLIISSPHAGRSYSEAFLEMTTLPLHELQKMEDRFVDQLLDGPLSHQASVIQSLFPRSFCDVNRDWRELDSAMFSPPLMRDDLIYSPKVDAGYGVIPRCTSPGRAIYRSCLPAEEADKRLAACWTPYHETLEHTQRTLTEQFGFSVILDIHSMPPLPQQRPCDIVLGDLNGHSCAPALIDFIEDAFSQKGYHVQRNIPYAGGYITNRYRHIYAGKHTLQIEINRACYLNLNTLTPNKWFRKMKKDLQSIIKDTITWIDHQGHYTLSPSSSFL